MVAVFVPAVQTSRAIVWERQRGSWDGLLMSSLRPRDIVLGKLLSALLPFWVVGLILAPFLIVTRYAWEPVLGFIEEGNLLARFLTALAFSAAFASLGLWSSLRARGESPAQFLTLMMITGSYLVAEITTRIVAGLFAVGMPPPGYADVLMPVTVCLPGAVAIADLLLRFRKLELLGRK